MSYHIIELFAGFVICWAFAFGRVWIIISRTILGTRNPIHAIIDPYVVWIGFFGGFIFFFLFCVQLGRFSRASARS